MSRISLNIIREDVQWSVENFM